MGKKIYVAGHGGMVGSALCRLLRRDASLELVTRSRGELDLRKQHEVNDFFAGTAIDEVYLAAGRVGGIHANNTYPADFIYENLMIECNVINAAFRSGVPKLLFLGSSCIYPREAPQPMAESALLTGTLEPTNEPYAIAKIAGLKLCESYRRQYAVDFRSIMPTNLYGRGDNFHSETSHVIPALMRRFHEARLSNSGCVTIWGTGTPKREFLHVDDMASACLHVMNLPRETYSEITSPQLGHINAGSGEEHSIGELAEIIANVTGYSGDISFDPSKPDGAPRKLLNSEKLAATGWHASYRLRDGLAATYEWFCETQADRRM